MFRFYLSVVLCLSAVTTHSDTAEQLKDEVISHCRESMGSFGASMVKSCVDQDMAAYEQLAGYSSEWEEVIQRCRSEMLSVGDWYLVKACTDQDISAEKALRDM